MVKLKEECLINILPFGSGIIKTSITKYFLMSWFTVNLFSDLIHLYSEQCHSIFLFFALLLLVDFFFVFAIFLCFVSARHALISLIIFQGLVDIKNISMCSNWREVGTFCFSAVL